MSPRALQAEASAVRFPGYPRTLDCVHCGLCLPDCPTYGITGREADSPRGRIYLLRVWAQEDGELSPGAREHLDLCLLCRACESVCPSGIRMGEMIESFRALAGRADLPGESMPWLGRFLLRHVLVRRDRIARLTQVLRIYQRTGLRRLADALLRRGPGRRLARLHRLQPAVGSRSEGGAAVERTRPGIYPPEGPRRARVGLFLGCVASEWFAPVHRATLRLLRRCGCEVIVPPEQTCCGALHRHAGLLGEARHLVERNLAVFRSAGVEAVIVNAAGCGASLAEPPREPPGGDESAAAPRAGPVPAGGPPVYDVCEFLRERAGELPLQPLRARVTCDTPCHLVHAQRIPGRLVEELLARIPDLELVSLKGNERCCGAGGVYNLLHPAMAEAILQEKVEAILETGAEIVATGNPGCALQIAAGLRGRGIEVLHPVEVLERSLGAGRARR